jgi:PhnB protein
MKLNPYLTFNGNCREAMEFYRKVLGGQIVMMLTHEGTPAAEFTSPDFMDKIMHARLIIGDNVLMASDSPPQYATTPAGFSVSVVVDDAAEGKRIFDALAEGGNVKMPFEETFWATGFGMLIDRFGTPWMVNAGEKSM